MKKQLKLAATIVAASTMLAACGGGEMKGYKQTESGLYYRFERQCKDSVQVQRGDVLVGEMTLRLDSTVLGSNVGNPARLMQAEPMYAIPLHEGVLLMHKGDRAVFSYEADTVAKFLESRQMPPTYEPGKGMRFYWEINLQDIVSRAELEEEEENFRNEMEKARVEEPNLIKQYVADQGITEKPRDNGLYVIVKKKGKGPKVAVGRQVSLNYTGRLLDGTVFDSSDPDECTAAGLQWHEPLSYIVGKMSLIPGWEQGVMDQPEGTSLRIVMPSALGYGPQGSGQQIPPYSPLVFDIDILSVK